MESAASAVIAAAAMAAIAAVAVYDHYLLISAGIALKALREQGFVGVGT